mgnify:CR=1 FL=1
MGGQDDFSSGGEQGPQGSVPPPDARPLYGQPAPTPAREPVPAPAAVPAQPVASEPARESGAQTQAEDLSKLDSLRLGARLADGILLMGVLYALRELTDVRGLALWVASLWIIATYFFLAEATTGQTPGKRLAGLRVARRDGSVPGLGAIGTRNIVRVLEEPMIALIALVASGRRRRQRIGDLLAGTTVMRAADAPAPARSAAVLAYPVLWAICGAALVLAVGPGDRRDRETAQATPTPGYYPPAPSFAGPMSPEWSRFAAEVDRLRAITFNEGIGTLRPADLHVERPPGERLSTPRT